jgi:hypothetical protein
LHRKAALRERAAATPELKAKAMVFFSDTKGPDALRAFLDETGIPLNDIRSIYRGWQEFSGGFDVNEKSLQDFNIQNKEDLVVLMAKQHRDHISSAVRDRELNLVELEKVQFKDPKDKENTRQACRQLLQRLQAYDANLAQQGTQFYSLHVEYELARLVEIQNRPDVELIDMY